MPMTVYSGATNTISIIGTTVEERGLTTDEFKAKFDANLAAFVVWFNDTHKTEFDAHLVDLVTDADGAHGLKIEAGTWTPSLADSLGGAASAYTNRSGSYYKIGKHVHIECFLRISNLGTLAADQNRITGLPFAAKSDSYSRGAISNSNLDYLAGYTSVVVIFVDAGVAIRIDALGDNVASSPVLANSITVNTLMSFSMDYITP